MVDTPQKMSRVRRWTYIAACMLVASALFAFCFYPSEYSRVLTSWGETMRSLRQEIDSRLTKKEWDTIKKSGYTRWSRIEPLAPEDIRVMNAHENGIAFVRPFRGTFEDFAPASTDSQLINKSLIEISYDPTNGAVSSSGAAVIYVNYLPDGKRKVRMLGYLWGEWQ